MMNAPARAGSLLLPESLLRVALRGEEAIPAWLTSRDESWIGALLVALERLAGCTVTEFEQAVEQHLIPMGLALGAPPKTLRGLAHLLLSLWTPVVVAPARPKEIRQVLFETAATGVAREQAIARTAEVLQIPPESVLKAAFADRPGARRLVVPRDLPSPARLVEFYNLALARGLIIRATHVTAWVNGNGQSVARYAALQRLICLGTALQEGTRFDLSGPLALFRQTTRYGHALVSFLPALLASSAWSLCARCVLRGETLTVRLSSKDPIVADPHLPKDTGTSVERKLLRAVRKSGSGWILGQETQAMRVGPRVFFPDFSLQRGSERVLVEILGFHTPAYLRAKLAALERAGQRHYLVCVDESLACSEDEPESDRVLRYRRTIDCHEFLRAVERLSQEARSLGPAVDSLSGACAMQ